MKLDDLVQSGDIIKTYSNRIGIVVLVEKFNTKIVIYPEGGFDYLSSFEEEEETNPNWIIQEIRRPEEIWGCNFGNALNASEPIYIGNLIFSLKSIRYGDLIKCRNGLYGIVTEVTDSSTFFVTFEDLSMKAYFCENLTFYDNKDYDIIEVYRTPLPSVTTKEEKMKNKIWSREI